MSQAAPLRATPLLACHQALGARLMPFAGWNLPLQYAGVLQEHRAVREAVGLFDVSHMGELHVAGPEATLALQQILTQDLARIGPGQAQYTLMCQADGGIVDDLIVYREPGDAYLLCVNASRIDADRVHLAAAAAPYRCQVRDVSADYAQLALQGPAAPALLASLTPAGALPHAAFAWADLAVAGLPGVRVARTGYTGEVGYELYCAPAQAEGLWGALLAAGSAWSLAPCGLAARDSLRLEMKYPLYGQDIGLDTLPLEAGLGWTLAWDKGDFIGRDALAAARAEGTRRAWIGLTTDGRNIPRPGYPLLHAGAPVGQISSGTFSPSLQRPIGCGYVPRALARIGTRLSVEIRGRAVDAEVVRTPFLPRRTP